MFNHLKYRALYSIVWIFCQWLGASAIWQHPSFEQYMAYSLRNFDNSSGAMLGLAPMFVLASSVMIAVFIFVVSYVCELFFKRTSLSFPLKNCVWFLLLVCFTWTIVISITHIVNLYDWGFFIAMLPYLIWLIYGVLTLWYFRGIMQKASPL